MPMNVFANPLFGAAAGRAGVTTATANPTPKKSMGMMGLSPEAWFLMSSALGKGAAGGGWAAAGEGMADAVRQQREQTEGEDRTDAQKRAVARMLAGDMKGAMSVLASAKGLEGDAMNMAGNLEAREHSERRDDETYDRGVRRSDFEYGRGRTDGLADDNRQHARQGWAHIRDRGEALKDQNTAMQHDKDMAGLDFGNKLKLLKTEAENAVPDFGDENGLRNQYLGQAKTFQDTARAAKAVRALSTDMNPAEQMALIFSTMKMLDPSSTVREGEYANAQNTTGAMGQLWNMYNKAKDGKFLDPTQITNFRTMVEGQYEAAEGSYGETLDHYRSLAQRYRMDPATIQDFRLPQQEPGATDQQVETAAAIPGALQGKLSAIEMEAWDELTPEQRQRLWQKHMGAPMQQRGLHVPGQRGGL